MKRRGKFVTRRTRVLSGHAGSLPAAKKVFRALAGLVLIFMALYAAGKIITYAGGKLSGISMPVNFNVTLPFSAPKYVIYSQGKVFAVRENGKFEQVTGGFDASGSPVLTGVLINENREAHRQALKMALSISRESLSTISEVSLKDPENITLITLDGVTVLAGPVLNETKMRNYEAAVRQASEMHKRYSVMDLRFRDRVIIR